MERHDRSPEISEASSLIELAEAMGFVETQDMRELRSEIIRLMSDGGDFLHKYREYDELAESGGLLAEAEGQIALMIMKALIFHSSGDTQAFEEEIRDTILYISGASNSYPERFKNIEDVVWRLKTKS